MLVRLGKPRAHQPSRKVGRQYSRKRSATSESLTASIACSRVSTILRRQGVRIMSQTECAEARLAPLQHQTHRWRASSPGTWLIKVCCCRAGGGIHLMLGAKRLCVGHGHERAKCGSAHHWLLLRQCCA